MYRYLTASGKKKLVVSSQFLIPSCIKYNESESGTILPCICSPTLHPLLHTSHIQALCMFPDGKTYCSCSCFISCQCVMYSYINAVEPLCRVVRQQFYIHIGKEEKLWCFLLLICPERDTASSPL